MEWYLPVIWAGLIGAAVAIYVILDGFDLGIGILFPFARNEADRDVMMNSVAPFWDGNETWLVLGGVGLFVVFPQAYANGTWTVPSHASLFTGLTLDEHGAHFDLEGRVRFDFTLPPDKETLAAELYRRGYATLGTFSNNWLNVMGA